MNRSIKIALLAFIAVMLVITLGSMIETNITRGVTGWFETNARAKTGAFIMSTTDNVTAETFTLEADLSISKAKVLVYRSATAPELLTLELFATDVNKKPTGSALATGTVDTQAVTEVTTGEEVTVTFGSAYGGSRGTMYALVGSRANVVDGDLYVCYSASGHSGRYFISQDDESTWVEDTTKDEIFSLYGTSGSSGIYQTLMRMAVWLLPVGALLAVFYGIFKLVGRRKV